MAKATANKVGFAKTDIHPGVRKVTNLPAKGDKRRTNELAAIRNALRDAEASVHERGDDAYVAQNDAAREALADKVHIQGRGKSKKYSVEEMFS